MVIEVDAPITTFDKEQSREILWISSYGMQVISPLCPSLTDCTVGNGEKKWKELDSVVETFMREQQVPGASVAVSKNQQILYTQGYGSAGASKRVHPDSVFRIASISKPITAFAILHLCLQYNVSLDAKVFGEKGILKSYKYKDKRVTAISIRHLLQHSAGWDRDIAGDAAFQRPASVARCHPESVEHNVALVSYTLTKRLQFKPGSRHAYSNLCYLVLGLVIEAITGLPFYSYLCRVLEMWGISGIGLGGPWRADWCSTEVEYFNNREPELVPSIHADRGELLPQYGGMAMGSAGPYGGLTATGTSLLQFAHTVENLLSENYHHHHCCCLCDGGQMPTTTNTNIEIKKNCDGIVEDNIMSMSSVDCCALSKLMKESLQRPGYESGYDWYGLGWDVEDRGQSWGHTGGMEGTSGILFHHGGSGLNWVLLLNAWAKDIDLNGVMKSAVCRAPGLKIFDCDVLSLPLTDIDNEDRGVETGEEGCTTDDGSGCIMFSKDKSQAIVLGVDEVSAYSVTKSLKTKGYMITWVSSVQHDLLLVSSLSSTSASIKIEKNITEVMNTSYNQNILDLGSHNLKFILLFTMGKDNGSREFLLRLNQSKEKLLLLIKENKTSGYAVEFIDSFCLPSGELRFSIVLVRSHSDIMMGKRSLHLALKADSYVRQIKTWVKSHSILCQSVTEANGNLFVSVLLESKTTTTNEDSDGSLTLKPPSSTYWVQIEPESFLTELNRKIKQNMTLTYAKFFNADGQSWVSGCWKSGQATMTNIYHRVAMSKFGLVPELAEAAADNIPLMSVSEYEDDGVMYYAGLWMAAQE